MHPKAADNDRASLNLASDVTPCSMSTINSSACVPSLIAWQLLRELKHTNIIMIKDVFLRPTVDPKQIWLLFEYAAYDLWVWWPRGEEATERVRAGGGVW